LTNKGVVTFDIGAVAENSGAFIKKFVLNAGALVAKLGAVIISGVPSGSFTAGIAGKPSNGKGFSTSMFWALFTNSLPGMLSQEGAETRECRLRVALIFTFGMAELDGRAGSFLGRVEAAFIVKPGALAVSAEALPSMFEALIVGVSSDTDESAFKGKALAVNKGALLGRFVTSATMVGACRTGSAPGSIGASIEVIVGS
jgi:hypothetical protein